MINFIIKFLAAVLFVYVVSTASVYINQDLYYDIAAKQIAKRLDGAFEDLTDDFLGIDKRNKRDN